MRDSAWIAGTPHCSITGARACCSKAGLPASRSPSLAQTGDGREMPLPYFKLSTSAKSCGLPEAFFDFIKFSKSIKGRLTPSISVSALLAKHSSNPTPGTPMIKFIRFGTMPNWIIVSGSRKSSSLRPKDVTQNQPMFLPPSWHFQGQSISIRRYLWCIEDIHDKRPHIPRQSNTGHYSRLIIERTL